MEDARRPLILAYLVVGLATVTLIAAVTGDADVLALGGGFGYLFAMIHGISFMIRARQRRRPARLDRSGRRILGATLGAVAVAAVANLIAVSRGGFLPGETASASVWLILVTVLCWRAWVLPSARRAAVLQLIAVVFAVPSIFTSIVGARHAVPDVDDRALFELLVPDTAMLVAFAVVACAGPVFDKLFASVQDKGPELVPEAIIHA